MTQTTKRILAMLMALAMLFAVVGCGEEKTDDTSSVTSTEDTTDDTASVSDDDFFGDAVEDIDDSTTTTQNNQGTTNGNGTTNQTGTTTTNKVSLDKYWKEIKEKMPDFSGKTIQVYNWNAQEEYPGLAGVVKNFTKATGVNVKWVREDGSTYLQKLTSLIATKKAPDIIRTHYPTPHVWALSQDLSVSKFDYNNEVWDQAFMSNNTVNGKVYAANTSASIFVGPQILFYNRSLITKYNLDDPYKLWKNDKWTLDAFEKLMRDYKKATGNAAIGGNMIDKYLTNVYAIPGEIKFDKKQQKFVTNLDDSRLIGVMQRAADIVNKENLTVSWGLDEFDRGDILMFCGTGVTAKRMNPYAATVKSQGNLGTVPWPTVSGNKNDAYAGWGDDGFAIPKGSPNPEIFPYYVTYVTDPSRYDLKTYFADDQCVEVFNFLTSLPASNRIAGLGFDQVAGNFVGDYKSIDEAISGKTGDQIPAALNANTNLSQLRADEYNKVLATVGK